MKSSKETIIEPEKNLQDKQDTERPVAFIYI